MSPSEDELRRALRAGEGDRPDTDRVVAAGAAARAQRRTRWVQGAAAVVLVGATAAVVGVVAGNRDDGGSSPRNGPGESAAVAPGGRGIASGEPTPGGTDRPEPSATDHLPIRKASCPDLFPARLQPGTDSPGRLFARTATSITVCAYGSAVRGADAPGPASLVFSGDEAQALQRSLENAATSPLGSSCTAVRPSEQRRLLFLATAADGTVLRPVTTTLTLPLCDTRTTNGASVRYGWVPPLDQRQRLYALSPGNPAATLPPRSPSGRVIGSPVR